MDTDLEVINILLNLMDDFPSIYKQDPPDVRAAYVYEHWKTTRGTFKYSDIPDTMYGGSLPIASKKKANSEAADEEEASEAKSRKAKKEKGVTQAEEVSSAMPTSQ